jgi:uncharacterized membrane protein
MHQNMTYLASIVIGDKPWIWPAVAVFAVSLLAVAWSYARANATGHKHLLPAILKTAGFAALAFFLLNPLWTRQRVQPRANILITLTDNSASMTIADHEHNEPRTHRLLGAFFNPNAQANEKSNSTVDTSTISRDVSPDNNATDTGLAPWFMRLDEQFDTRHYQFDKNIASLKHANEFASLRFDGTASSLMTALDTLRSRYRGRPVAGILLFSDGNATDIPQGVLDLTDLPPIYPVIIGDAAPQHDLGITHFAVNQTAFEDSPVTITADARALGYEGETVVAKLLDKQGQTIEQHTHKPVQADQTLAFRFQLKPQKAGVGFYHLQIETEDGNDTAKVNSQDATQQNNQRLIVVNRDRGPYRILYVSGRPNWEFKFINRALVDDPQLQLVGLIRIAKREPKFAWRDNKTGTAADRTNPLFKGFDGKKDDTEEYDEPVLVRLNTEDENELRGGFPKSAETLFRYHAIVLDDVDASFFKHDQLALIERFVTERNGGLMMLGGAETLRQGRYANTPVGRLLPVYLNPNNNAPQTTPAHFELSREGAHENWVRLRSTELDEAKRLAAMPLFHTLNQISGVKPGATVLAYAKDTNGTRWPALVTQNFGGRVAVSTIGDYWRWTLKRNDSNREDPGKMWRQTLRWLVAQVPAKVTLSVEPLRSDPGSPLRLTINVHDKQFAPVDDAVVRIRVLTQPPHTKTDTPPKNTSTTGDTLSEGHEIDSIIELTAQLSQDEPGRYFATYLPRTPGAYRFVATATRYQSDQESQNSNNSNNSNDDPSSDAIQVGSTDTSNHFGQAEKGWAYEPAANEFLALTPNRNLLETLANRTGGQVIEIEDLDDFVDELPSKQSPVMEMAVDPLWNQWWAFALALLCFVSEWCLRRVRGLP